MCAMARTFAIFVALVVPVGGRVRTGSTRQLCFSFTEIRDFVASFCSLVVRQEWRLFFLFLTGGLCLHVELGDR